MNIRLATEADLDQLIRMRWDFTYEHAPDCPASYEAFYEECKSFLEKAIAGETWFIWIAEMEGRIVSHIYIELIHKVPRPGRMTYPFAYMTNVYTVPGSRSQGVGGQLLRRIKQWASERRLEFIMVWPSDEAIPFYAKNGYKHCTEPMELTLD